MAYQQPPDWETDTLSNYFRDAEYNDRVTALKYPAVYELLKRLHGAFEAAEALVANDTAIGKLIPRFLFVRTHSSVLAGCRLGMSGQLPEAHAVLRTGIEQAWYALHIFNDPNPYNRTEIWLRRNENATALSRCKSEFTVKNVRETHNKVDVVTASNLHEIYEKLIDYGAHPNHLGILSAARITETPSRMDFKIGILYPNETAVMFSLRLAIAVGLGTLKIFRNVYSEQYKNIELDAEIDALVSELNNVFRKYGS